MVRGSNGEVLAPIGDGKLVEASLLDILVTEASGDCDLSLHLRRALVGLAVQTVFGSEQLNGAVPYGSRVAYASDVMNTLQIAGKTAEASELLAAVKAHGPKSKYAFLVFKMGEYRIVGTPPKARQ